MEQIPEDVWPLVYRVSGEVVYIRCPKCKQEHYVLSVLTLEQQGCATCGSALFSEEELNGIH